MSNSNGYTLVELAVALFGIGLLSVFLLLGYVVVHYICKFW